MDMVERRKVCVENELRMRRRAKQQQQPPTTLSWETTRRRRLSWDMEWESVVRLTLRLLSNETFKCLRQSLTPYPPLPSLLCTWTWCTFRLSFAFPFFPSRRYDRDGEKSTEMFPMTSRIQKEMERQQLLLTLPVMYVYYYTFRTLKKVTRSIFTTDVAVVYMNLVLSVFHSRFPFFHLQDTLEMERNSTESFPITSRIQKRDGRQLFFTLYVMCVLLLVLDTLERRLFLPDRNVTPSTEKEGDGNGGGGGTTSKSWLDLIPSNFYCTSLKWHRATSTPSAKAGTTAAAVVGRSRN